MRERSVVRLSVTPSTKCSCWLRRRYWRRARRRSRGAAARISRGRGRRGLRLGRLADFERIDADRLGYVLELGRAEIVDREIEPPFDLPIGVLGQADRAGRADAFQPRGDIDSVAHQIAVGLLDDIAKMDADAEFDAALGRQARVALDEAVLHFDRATHGVDHAAELDEAAVAGALDDPPAMRGDGGVDQIAAQPPQARQGAILVRASQPAVADHIGDQDRRNFPGFGHGASSRVMQNTTRKGFSRASQQLDAIGSKPALPRRMPARGRFALSASLSEK